MEIMESGARRTHISQQFHHGILGSPRHSASCTDRTAFDEAVDDSGAGLGVQAVHIDYYAKAALGCQ
jgi:predicted ATPase